MADFTLYPLVDENGNFPDKVRKAMAESAEVKEVINGLIKQSGGGTGGTGGTGGSVVTVGGVPAAYYDAKTATWPSRPAVTTTVWWLATTVSGAPVPPGMIDGDMLTRLPAATA